jgi:hypothetical protein
MTEKQPKKRERSPDVLERRWKVFVYFVERRVKKDGKIELLVNEQVVRCFNLFSNANN